MHKPLWPLLLVSLTLGACATVPTGPSVMVLPGTGKPFEQFRGDETVCRQFALQQVGGATAQQNANDSAVTSAAVGTLVGAAAGAAIGGRGGAAVGAGGGLLVGSAAGADASQRSAFGTQRPYDHALIQCMYAHGPRVPVPAGMAAPHASSAPAGSTRAGNAPPPPSRLPPPPPPR